MKPITIQTHYNEVRNAYRGPETWQEITSAPLVTEIDWNYRNQKPRRYLYVKPIIYSASDQYALWYIYPVVKLVYVTNNLWWKTLRFLHRCNLIHSNQPVYCITRFRNIRLGPEGQKNNQLGKGE